MARPSALPVRASQSDLSSSSSRRPAEFEFASGFRIVEMLGWVWLDDLLRLGVHEIGGGFTVLLEENKEDVEVDEFEPEAVWLDGELDGEGNKNGVVMIIDG
jgi:hypothetical protein